MNRQPHLQADTGCLNAVCSQAVQRSVVLALKLLQSQAGTQHDEFSPMWACVVRS